MPVTEINVSHLRGAVQHCHRNRSRALRPFLWAGRRPVSILCNGLPDGPRGRLRQIPRHTHNPPCDPWLRSNLR
jgi:hypothetical protein